MGPVRAVYVPQFSSQLSSSKRDEPQPGQTEAPSRCHHGDKRGNKRDKVRGEKTRSVLKVKLPLLNNHTKTLPVEDESARRWTLKPAANIIKTTARPGGDTVNISFPHTSPHTEAGAGTHPDSVGGDVFCFSQRPASKVVKGKEKAKIAVLRTISRMLEENQLIRQRLTTLSQPN